MALLIARDFDYSNPAAPVLDTIRDGIRERLVFPSLDDAHTAHAALRAEGAEYIEAHEDGRHARFVAAKVVECSCRVGTGYLCDGHRAMRDGRPAT
jgi:hypothetical protein